MVQADGITAKRQQREGATKRRERRRRDRPSGKELC
jgi:hypothetical protein